MPLLMCPNCDGAMQAVQRAGVEFDMCPRCRGVWLDRGELEKLMAFEREETQATFNAPGTAPRPYVRPDHHLDHHKRDDDDDDDRYRRYGRYGHQKKKRFDLFDIFD